MRFRPLNLNLSVSQTLSPTLSPNLRMLRAFGALAAMIILTGFAALLACSAASAKVAATPDPAVDDSLAAKSGQQMAVLSGGCFWGIQLVFEHVKGVVKVTAGYTGGAAKSAVYEVVSTGTTGHAESVQIVYDPSRVTYGQLLKVFFSVAHDPTELNFQGPDHGTQYRSSIWYSDPDQQRIAQAYIAQLDQANAFPHKIVTQVVPFQAFYSAEDYHQDFAVQNPDNPYIMTFDLPKLANLKKVLPDLYVAHR
jgi:peptide-methionine (S)-S-oxide reductase